MFELKITTHKSPNKHKGPGQNLNMDVVSAKPAINAAFSPGSREKVTKAVKY